MYRALNHVVNNRLALDRLLLQLCVYCILFLHGAITASTLGAHGPGPSLDFVPTEWIMKGFNFQQQCLHFKGASAVLQGTQPQHVLVCQDDISLIFQTI